MVSCFLLEKNPGETFQIDQGGFLLKGVLYSLQEGNTDLNRGSFKVLLGLFHIRMGCRKTANSFAFAFIIILYVNMRTCVDANPVKNPSGT